MTIIQSLIISLEKNNNNKLIEKLEILEKFVSSEESNKLSTEALNKLISDRVKSNKEQEGIKNAKEDTKKEDNSKLSKSVEKEVIETETNNSEGIMSKFKWVLIGIGIFVLLIFISSVIYWYMNMSSTPSEIPILQPDVTQTDTTSQPSHIQNNVVTETQEYSYIPDIFQRNSKKSEELRLSEEGRLQNELRSSRENERVQEKEDEKVQVKVDERVIVEEKVNEIVQEKVDEIVPEKVDEIVQVKEEEVQEKEVQEKEEDKVQVKEEEVQEKEEELQVKEVQEERRSQKEKIFQQEKEDILKNKGYKLSSKSNFPL